MNYVLSKSAPDPILHNTLRTILSPDATSHVGFIFSERLMNMPIEVIPHMYRMLADEIQWACDDGEPYHFDHFLLLSRTYTLSDEEAEVTLATPQQQKRRKGAPAPSAVGGVFTFHHEDVFIQEVRLALPTRPVRFERNKTLFESFLRVHSITLCLTHLPVTKIVSEFNREVA